MPTRARARGQPVPGRARGTARAWAGQRAREGRDRRVGNGCRRDGHNRGGSILLFHDISRLSRFRSRDGLSLFHNCGRPGLDVDRCRLGLDDGDRLHDERLCHGLRHLAVLGGGFGYRRGGLVRGRTLIRRRTDRVERTGRRRPSGTQVHEGHCRCWRYRRGRPPCGRLELARPVMRHLGMRGTRRTAPRAHRRALDHPRHHHRRLRTGRRGSRKGRRRGQRTGAGRWRREGRPTSATGPERQDLRPHRLARCCSADVSGRARRAVSRLSMVAFPDRDRSGGSGGHSGRRDAGPRSAVPGHGIPGQTGLHRRRHRRCRSARRQNAGPLGCLASAPDAGGDDHLVLLAEWHEPDPRPRLGQVPRLRLDQLREPLALEDGPGGQPGEHPGRQYVQPEQRVIERQSHSEQQNDIRYRDPGEYGDPVDRQRHGQPKIIKLV